MNKQYYAQSSTKSLNRSYSIESMDSETDRIFVNSNLKDVLKNFNSCGHLTVCKQMSTISFWKLLTNDPLKKYV